MQSKKEIFKIQTKSQNKAGNWVNSWRYEAGEKIDDETAIRRDKENGYIIWDIKTGLMICSKHCRSKAEALAYFENDYKKKIEEYKKGPSYQRNINKATEIFSDPLKQEENQRKEQQEEKAETMETKQEEKKEIKEERKASETKEEKKEETAKEEPNEAQQGQESKPEENNTQPATERQKNYLRALFKKLHNRAIIDVSIDNIEIDKLEASRLIDESLKLIERGRKGNKKVPPSYLVNNYRIAA